MSKQSESSIIRQEVSDRSNPIELNDRQLDTVAGGNKSSAHLFEACTGGKHIDAATITVRYGRRDQQQPPDWGDNDIGTSLDWARIYGWPATVGLRILGALIAERSA